MFCAGRFATGEFVKPTNTVDLHVQAAPFRIVFSRFELLQRVERFEPDHDCRTTDLRRDSAAKAARRQRPCSALSSESYAPARFIDMTIVKILIAASSFEITLSHRGPQG
jgi:hypothetical protein